MPDIFDRVLPLNLIANTVIFYIAARVYLLPLVSRLRPQQILVPILLLHSTRHLGMLFLTRGATYPGLPPQFAYPAAFWRSANGHNSARNDPDRVAPFFPCQTGSVGFQRLRYSRPGRGNHPCHNLQRAGRNGTILLDSGLLGPVIAGNALRDLSCSSETSRLLMR